MKELDINEIAWNDFAKIDMRVGTIIEAHLFEKARVPTYQVAIDTDLVTLLSPEKNKEWSKNRLNVKNKQEILKT